MASRRNGVRAGIVYAAAPLRPTLGVRFAGGLRRAAVARGAGHGGHAREAAGEPRRVDDLEPRGRGHAVEEDGEAGAERSPMSTVAPAGQPAIPSIAA